MINDKGGIQRFILFLRLNIKKKIVKEYIYLKWRLNQKRMEIQQKKKIL